MDLNLTNVIGSGAYATVYRYSATSAVKSSLLSTDEPSVYREIDCLAKCKGAPNLIQLLNFSFNKSKTTAYLFISLYENSLHNLFESDEFIEPKAYKFVTDIATGLYHLHKNKIIHRDLNPKNILVKKENDEFYFCITDFGISRLSCVLDKLDNGSTKSDIYADHNFCAPEMHFKKEHDLPVDIWSFGHLISAFVTKTRCNKSWLIYTPCPMCNISDSVIKPIFDSGKSNYDVSSVFNNTVNKIKGFTHIPKIDEIAELFKQMIEVCPSKRITVEKIVENLKLDLITPEKTSTKEIQKDVVVTDNSFLTCEQYYDVVCHISRIYKPEHSFNFIRIIELFNRYVKLSPNPIVNYNELDMIIAMCITVISSIFDVDPVVYETGSSLQYLHIFNYQLTNPKVEIIVEYIDKHIPCYLRKGTIKHFFKQLCDKGINPAYLSVQELYESFVEMCTPYLNNIHKIPID